MKYKKNLKFLGIFLIMELMVIFITSLLNLVGLNSGITSIILLISNVMIFFILAYYNAKNSLRRGFLIGIYLSIGYILIIYFINTILFGFNLHLSTIIYYSILVIVSMIGGSVGKNKQIPAKK